MKGGPTPFDDVHAVHYLPLGTTLLSAAFFVVLSRAALVRRTGPHLWWWAAGIFTYGLGTGIESAITLLGNSVALNKAWYVAGALLGGYPLAQGSVYLLYRKRVANVLTAMTVPLLVALAVLVFLSPANLAALDAHRPTGAILEWRWLRSLTPIVNLYSAAFLIGGAVVSAMRYAKLGSRRERVWGNALIALGALLPGVGGAMAKGGFVEALYVGEFVGLVLIWIGYGVIAAKKQGSTASQGGIADGQAGSRAAP